MPKCPYNFPPTKHDTFLECDSCPDAEYNECWADCLIVRGHLDVAMKAQFIAHWDVFPTGRPKED